MFNSLRSRQDIAPSNSDNTIRETEADKAMERGMLFGGMLDSYNASFFSDATAGEAAHKQMADASVGWAKALFKRGKKALKSLRRDGADKIDAEIESSASTYKHSRDAYLEALRIDNIVPATLISAPETSDPNFAAFHARAKAGWARLSSVEQNVILDNLDVLGLFDKTNPLNLDDTAVNPANGKEYGQEHAQILMNFLEDTAYANSNDMIDKNERAIRFFNGLDPAARAQLLNKMVEDGKITDPADFDLEDMHVNPATGKAKGIEATLILLPYISSQFKIVADNYSAYMKNSMVLEEAKGLGNVQEAFLKTFQWGLSGSKGMKALKLLGLGLATAGVFAGGTAILGATVGAGLAGGTAALFTAGVVGVRTIGKKWISRYKLLASRTTSANKELIDLSQGDNYGSDVMEKSVKAAHALAKEKRNTELGLALGLGAGAVALVGAGAAAFHLFSDNSSLAHDSGSFVSGVTDKIKGFVGIHGSAEVPPLGYNDAHNSLSSPANVGVGAVDKVRSDLSSLGHAMGAVDEAGNADALGDNALFGQLGMMKQGAHEFAQNLCDPNVSDDAALNSLRRIAEATGANQEAIRNAILQNDEAVRAISDYMGNPDLPKKQLLKEFFRPFIDSGKWPEFVGSAGDAFGPDAIGLTPGVGTGGLTSVAGHVAQGVEKGIPSPGTPFSLEELQRNGVARGILPKYNTGIGANNGGNTIGEFFSPENLPNDIAGLNHKCANTLVELCHANPGSDQYKILIQQYFDLRGSIPGASDMPLAKTLSSQDIKDLTEAINGNTDAVNKLPVGIREQLEQLAHNNAQAPVPPVDGAVEAAKKLADSAKTLMDSFTSGFNVESGHGFIVEIQELGNANGIPLTDQQATDMYTQLMKGLSNDPSKLLVGGLDEVYTITDQPDVNGVLNIGIAAPGQKQFTPEAAKILAGLMATNK